jgi:hypothetical protein
MVITVLVFSQDHTLVYLKIYNSNISLNYPKNPCKSINIKYFGTSFSLLLCPNKKHFLNDVLYTPQKRKFSKSFSI